MDRRWTCVFAGTYGTAIAVRSELEAHGLLVFVPDVNLKLIDPFLSGALPLELRVFVPRGSAAEAREIVGGEAVPEAEIAEEYGGEAPEEQPGDAGLALGARDFASRVRWAIVFPLAAPWALYMAWRYLRLVRRLREEPVGHRFTLAAAGVCLAYMPWWLSTLAMLIDPDLGLVWLARQTMPIYP